jgi:hypothetical protein
MGNDQPLKRGVLADGVLIKRLAITSYHADTDGIHVSHVRKFCVDEDFHFGRAM